MWPSSVKLSVVGQLNWHFEWVSSVSLLFFIYLFISYKRWYFYPHKRPRGIPKISQDIRPPLSSGVECQSWYFSILKLYTTNRKGQAKIGRYCRLWLSEIPVNSLLNENSKGAKIRHRYWKESFLFYFNISRAHRRLMKSFIIHLIMHFAKIQNVKIVIVVLKMETIDIN